MESAGRIDFYSLPLSKLEAFLERKNEKKFRAKQLFQWVYEKNVTDSRQMTNLSRSFREQVTRLFKFELPEVLDRRISRDGTRKYLFGISKGEQVEAVMIPSGDRTTLCLSSEVGCNMACTFCFTGKQKLKSKLTAGEIVGQFLQAQRDMENEKITNIVFMGMGEPLDNIPGVFSAIEIFKSDFGLNIGRKKITVSTSGLIPQMEEISRSGVRMAVSLNAPNDKIRTQIMPINLKYPIKDLMEACKAHVDKTKDRVTFEYVLLKNVNDHRDHARQVGDLVKNIPCKINLIPFNEHPDSGHQRPHRDQIFLFQKYLLDRGFHVTIRRTMGRDIFAACGQLTSLYKGQPQQQNLPTGTVG